MSQTPLRLNQYETIQHQLPSIRDQTTTTYRKLDGVVIDRNIRQEISNFSKNAHFNLSGPGNKFFMFQ